MSVIVVPGRPSLRNDLAALDHHLRTRLALLARDPLPLLLLALAGLLTIPLWILVGSGSVVWLVGMAFAGAPGARSLASGLILLLLLLDLLLSALVAITVSGRPSTQSRGTAVRAMPALPIGSRSRLVAEATAGLTVVLAARVLVLLAGGESVRNLLGEHNGAAWAIARTSVLGFLSSFPLVLAWLATARWDWRGGVRPGLTAVLTLLAAFMGAMGQLGSALLLVILLSAFVLFRLDHGDRADSQGRATRVGRPRVSPGATAQFRQDAWRGALRLWPLAAPLIPLLLLGLVDPRRYVLLLFLLQLLVLIGLAFFPFGLPLAARGAPLFSDRFLRAWSPLPVPPERVSRAVYVHALAMAGSAWLLLSLYAAWRGEDGWASQFLLPGVFLTAAIVLCEAVGDRARGLLAIACLVGFLMVAPTSLVIAREVLNADVLWERRADVFLAQAYLLGLVGSLPPLVHLRSRRLVAPAAA